MVRTMTMMLTVIMITIMIKKMVMLIGMTCKTIFLLLLHAKQPEDQDRRLTLCFCEMAHAQQV